MAKRELIFRAHALRRMFEREISRESVRRAVVAGRVIQSYPEDVPYPSRLMLWFEGKRPIHVVAADIPNTQRTVIITVYEPDPQKWSEDYITRKQP
ncbi:MAG: DUF4258 domain-containing protein [Phycisphaeraceae bacterium]